MSALAVFAALVPVFLLILSGVAAKRWLIPHDAHWIGAERLVYYVLFPALLILTLARADLTRVPVEEVAGALIAAVLLMTLLCLALRPLMLRALGVDGPAFTSVFQGATRWQTYVGLAVAGNLFGDYGLALASVAAAAMIPLLNIINTWVLVHYASPAKLHWSAVLIAVAKNPFIWSCLIGIMLNVLHVPIPAMIAAYADALGRAALALGLLLVGAGLHIRGLIRPQAATLIAAALKLIVMPAISIALAKLFGASGQPLAVIACCAAVPAASNAYVLAKQMGGDTQLLAEILTVQTVMAAITMPLVIEITLR
jgi:predicted permease